MKNRQFVKLKYPKCELEFVSVPSYDYGQTGYKYTIREKRSYYNIRETYPNGKIIGRGATALKAWKATKLNIKGKETNG